MGRNLLIPFGYEPSDVENINHLAIFALTFYVKIWRYIALNLQISTLNLLVKPLALSSSNFNTIAVLNKSLQALGSYC
ncbi:hypothetical protein [uncultured Campylobacter sp.]|uniref:hypothetical protein n=1 Tax=uncultured Campylobacter sp. TaxID=218934 RepID=UPI0026399E6F|nr:hypothetical protein [uncultured Campylobacter sp.]